MNPQQEKNFNEWLSKQPEFIRALAIEFPPGIMIGFKTLGINLYLKGFVAPNLLEFGDNDPRLVFTRFNPVTEPYDAENGRRFYLTPQYVRDIRKDAAHG